MGHRDSGSTMYSGELAAREAGNSALVVPPKTDGSWWRVLTQRGPLEKGMANTFSSIENPMNSIKRQKDRTLKDELPRLVGAQ